MVLVIGRSRIGEAADNNVRRQRFWTVSRLLALFRPDEPLRALLAKKDDRLLADAGLNREDIIGPAKLFWKEWARVREPWLL